MGTKNIYIEIGRGTFAAHVAESSTKEWMCRRFYRVLSVWPKS